MNTRNQKNSIKTLFSLLGVASASVLLSFPALASLNEVSTSANSTGKSRQLLAQTTPGGTHTPGSTTTPGRTTPSGTTTTPGGAITPGGTGTTTPGVQLPWYRYTTPGGHKLRGTVQLPVVQAHNSCVTTPGWHNNSRGKVQQLLV
jgi:hypothetical protein